VTQIEICEPLAAIVCKQHSMPMLVNWFSLLKVIKPKDRCQLILGWKYRINRFPPLEFIMYFSATEIKKNSAF